MNEERIKEIFSDKEFVKELFSKETPEEAQALLAEKDIDLTVAEIIKFGEVVAQKLQQAEETGENVELTEEELEDVAGGYLGIATIIIVSIAIPLITGTGIAMGISTNNFTTRLRW